MDGETFLCILLMLGVLFCGFIAGFCVGNSSGIKTANTQLCKQLYSNTNEYLINVNKPFTHNIKNVCIVK